MAKSNVDSDCGQTGGQSLGQGLIAITCDTTTDNNVFIQNILKTFNPKTEDIEECKPKTICFGSDQRVDCFDLDIDNKYYSTKIYLFDIKDKHIMNKRFVDCVNGVLIWFDFNQDSSFVGVQSWQPFLNQYDNQIKLLVCQTIDHNFPKKSESILKWCLDNEFELIEICPQTDDHSEDNQTIDEFAEVDGFLRIKQAIEAYNWPDIQLKERRQYNPSPKFKDLIDKEVFNSINDNSLTEPKESKHFDEKDIEFENFDELFIKFNEMKVKASEMSETDRRGYAERVTLAFWKAIDGDPQEIDGLDTTEET